MVEILKNLRSSRKVTLHDVASPKPSRAANKAVSGAFVRASRRQAEIRRKAAAIRAK